MILNDEQRVAVAEAGNVCVSACPGSGKTRTIVAKLLACVEDARGTARRVACITYTHAAVNEIERRLREYGSGDDEDYIEIGTIHSFCLLNILSPFGYLLPELSGGFEVIAPDSEEWTQLVISLADKYAVDRSRLDGFTNVHRSPDGSLFVPPEIPDEAAEELVAHLDSNALVSFSDIVYHSTRLVEQVPFIGRGLASRFAWILVDEFQDTSEGQVCILRAIAGVGKTLFFLVGDQNQSIMSFAGAHPLLLASFPVEIGARTDIRLPGNYRCSEKVVRYAELLIPTAPPMQAVGEYKDFPVEPELHHVPDKTTGVFEYFLPVVDDLGIPLGDAAVLAPWWLTLYQLAHDLRERGIPVIGPGSRPYRRTRLLATFAEHLCAYTEDRDPDLFRASQRALFLMLVNVAGNTEWGVYGYEGRKCLCAIASRADAIRDECGGAAVSWLQQVAVEITTILTDAELLASDMSQVLPDSATDMIRDMERNKVDTANLSVSDLALYARPKECLQLLTMHGSKGREFDAVAVIDLHAGRVPHFSCRTEDQYEEARRLLYVATTRPRKVLMYFTDASHARNEPSPFLGEMGLIS